MNCPQCDEDALNVTKVFQAGERAETRNLSCRACGFKAASVTFLVLEQQPLMVRKRRRYRSGAFALARRIENGQIRPPDITRS